MCDIIKKHVNITSIAYGCRALDPFIIQYRKLAI